MKSYSIDDMIARATGREEETSSLYQDLSRKVQDPAARALLKELSSEELKHKEKLQDFKKKKTELGLGTKSIEDQRITDFMEKPSVNKYADAKDVLRFAIQDEEDSRKFYASWAESMLEEEPALFLKKLAEEELKHKVKLEKSYQEMFSADN